MITRISGILLEKKAPFLMIDVHDIGYELQVPMSTFYQLPAVGEPVTLLTHFIVREDAQLLFGFFHESERKLFRALIKVNGVGTKLAMTILSGIEPDRFVKCVQSEDSDTLMRIPGIGKKTAERLLIETRDTLSEWENKFIFEKTMLVDFNQAMQDAMSGLTALGYKPQEAKRAISKVHQPNHSSEQLIRLALQQMIK